MSAIANQRVLVTGAAVRIGRAIAQAFAQAGASVIVHCNHSVAKGEALVKQLRQDSAGDHVLVQADLTDADQRQQLFAALLADGPVHGLVNSASIYRRDRLRNLETEHLLRDYQINFIAPFDLMTRFARQQLSSSWIINMLDQRVATVDPGAASYGFAKKSLRDATEAAALEWAPAIRVNAVAPGLVLPPPGVAPAKMQPLLANVPMLQASALPEIAQACVFLAGSQTITGTVLYVDGGMHLRTAQVAEQLPSSPEGHCR